MKFGNGEDMNPRNGRWNVARMVCTSIPMLSKLLHGPPNNIIVSGSVKSNAFAEICAANCKGRKMGCGQLFCTLWCSSTCERSNENCRYERNCKFYCYLLTEVWRAIDWNILLLWLVQQMDQPFDVFAESPQFRRAPPMVRVEKMFEDIQSKLPGAPQFLLCLLPDRKNCEIYG